MKSASRILHVALAWSVFLASPTLAQWQNVAPGIDYQEFTLSDPNNLFVARLERSNTNCIIDSSIAQGQLKTGFETVSGMAARYDDTINYWGQYWGQRNDVVVAINGDFYNTTTAIPTSGQVHSGWYAKRFNDFTGGSGFAWQLDRDVFIGECVRHMSSKQKVAFPGTGGSMNINAINTDRAENQLILYTPQYAPSTTIFPPPLLGVHVVDQPERARSVIFEVLTWRIEDHRGARSAGREAVDQHDKVLASAVAREGEDLGAALVPVIVDPRVAVAGLADFARILPLEPRVVAADDEQLAVVVVDVGSARGAERHHAAGLGQPLLVAVD